LLAHVLIINQNIVVKLHLCVSASHDWRIEDQVYGLHFYVSSWYNLYPRSKHVWSSHKLHSNIESVL